MLTSRILPSRLVLVVALAAGLSSWPSDAGFAQDAAMPASVAELEQRVRELEEILQKDQGRRLPQAADNPGSGVAAMAAVPSLGDDSSAQFLPAAFELTNQDGGIDAERRPDFAGWQDGFYLRTADKDFSLRITGQIQADYRTFLDGVDGTDIDTFLVRRARLGIEATVCKYYEFRLLPDFGQSQTRLQDAYLNVHYWDAFQIQAGKFKQPFSYEQLIQDRFVPVLERSIIDQLVPARDEGVMLHGQKLFDDRLDYAVAVSNGEQNGDVDTGDNKDLTARVALRPFKGLDDDSILQGAQFGMSGGTGVEREAMLPATLRTPATVPWLQYNSGVRANGVRNRWSPELSYFYGPLGFASQYFWMRQDIQSSTSPQLVSVPFEGYYLLATLLLTGEERTTYSQAIAPLNPFDPHCPLACGGAWELVTRVSRLQVGDVVFASGPARLANPSLYSSGASELTLGCNWYLNKLVRVQFNWEHSWFDNPVRLGPGAGGLLSSADALLTRFQVVF